MTAPPPRKKRKLGTTLKQSTGADFSGNSQTLKTPEEKAKTEVEAYQRAPEQDVEDYPLQWWKAEENRYPILATLARKYLCIPASSAASERLFSASGLVVTPRRAALKPHKVNMLGFLSRNLR